MEDNGLFAPANGHLAWRWKPAFASLMLTLMSNTVNQASAPAGWMESLARSKVQIAAGESIPLLPILDRLRATAERLEAEQGLFPDGMKLTIKR